MIMNHDYEFTPDACEYELFQPLMTFFLLFHGFCFCSANFSLNVPNEDEEMSSF
jgi:hypothetical protein